jgi:hypothetical protein
MSFLTLAAVAGETTLGAAITSTTATTITVASAGGTSLIGDRKSHAVDAGVFIAVDSEIMQVVQVNSDTSLTVKRGAFGTTAATHSNSAPVHAINAAGLYLMLCNAILAAAPGS